MTADLYNFDNEIELQGLDRLASTKKRHRPIGVKQDRHDRGSEVFRPENEKKPVMPASIHIAEQLQD